MARRSSGGRSARPARRPAARSAPPQKVNNAPPPAPVQSSSGGGGIGSAIVDGLAWGVGTSVAHRAVDAVMGPRTIEVAAAAVPAPAPAATPAPAASSMGGSDACNTHSKAFEDCLNSYGNDISKCQFYMDMLAECKRNSGSAMSY